MPASAQLLVILAGDGRLLGHRDAPGPQPAEEGGSSSSSALEVGDEVVLSAGIFGTIRSLTDTRAEIEVSPGTVLTVARQVVVRRVEDLPTTPRTIRDPPTRTNRPVPPRPRTEENQHRGEEDAPAGPHAAHLRAGDRRPLRAGRARRRPGSPAWGWTSRAAPGSRCRRSRRAVTPTKLKQAAGIVDGARQRQRRLGGRGLHLGQPQHHRRDPGQERLQPRRLGQAHGPAALPHRGRLAAAGQARRPSPSPSPSPSGTASQAAVAVRQGDADNEEGQPGEPEPSPGPVRRHPQRDAAARHRVTAVDAGRRRQAPTQPPPRAPRSTNPVAWAQNPGEEWLTKFAAFTCPAKGKAAAPVADNPDQPLITCDDKGQKFLLSNAVIEGTDLKSASYGIPQNGTTLRRQPGLQGQGPQGVRQGHHPAARQQRHLRDRARRPGRLLRRRQRADPGRQRPDHR